MRSTTPHIRSSAAFRLVASVVLVAGVWLAAVSRWVVSDLVVRWDSKNQFYAFFRFLSAALRAGRSEHRVPAIAGVQSGVALWGLLDPAPAMRTFDLCVFAHSLVGGIGIAIIGWRARWPIPANVLAAALFCSEARRLTVSSIPALLSFTRCSRWRCCCCNSRFNGDHCSWPRALPS
jgi:hypothetical protein